VKNRYSIGEGLIAVYLKEEFKINNFIFKMPSKDSLYFEKCRTILPEVDRIFKQYNLIIEEGMIDQELIQMSSSSYNKNIREVIEEFSYQNK